MRNDFTEAYVKIIFIPSVSFCIFSKMLKKGLKLKLLNLFSLNDFMVFVSVFLSSLVSKLRRNVLLHFWKWYSLLAMITYDATILEELIEIFELYFSQELAAVGGQKTNAKASRINSKKVKDNLINQFKAPARNRRGKLGAAKVESLISTKDGPRKIQKAELLAKEEGEMSDNEEVYEQFKEQKWMEWCQDFLADEIKTLGRLNGFGY